YNGINTVLRNPDSQAFELQYHTPESFEVKNEEMHKLYEKQRLIHDVKSKEYIELDDKMFELSASMEVPNGIEGIKNAR
ncbi:MAG: head morphogenesis protein, partial [Eubacterium sp.]